MGLGIVFLAVTVCAVAIAALAAFAVVEFLRRRTFARSFWLEAQPSSRLGLRTGHRAFSGLVAACRDAGAPVPTVTLLAVSDRSVQAYLAVPSERAPEPWRASADGVTWTADLDAAEAVLTRDETPASPAVGDPAGGAPAGGAGAEASAEPELFVTAGRTGDATVFLNLAAAPGPVALSGAPRVRRQLLRRWIAELTQPAWRLDVNALVVGDPRLLSGRATDASDTLRADSARDFPGGLLVVGAASAAERLAAVHQRAVAEGLNRVAAVTDGATTRAAWRLRAGENGELSSSVFPPVDWRESPESAVRSTR